MQKDLRQDRFEMDVVDVFNFEDGRTVFVGTVAVGPAYISACDCELTIAGDVVARFRIEGEMIPLKRAPNHLRSVSTNEEVDLRLVQVSKVCKLQSV